MMFYLTNPIWTAPNGQVWEEALKDVFVIDTSPFPSETAMYADLVLPDHTYLERMQDAPTYPFQGWPMTQLRMPAVSRSTTPSTYGDTLIEIGKRMNGPMGEYYRRSTTRRTCSATSPRASRPTPATTASTASRAGSRRASGTRSPTIWRQVNGVFYEWDGQGYNKRDDARGGQGEAVQDAVRQIRDPLGLLEENADWIAEKTGRDRANLMFPIWEEPQHPGGGDLYLVTPKVALHAEGRGANMPMAIAHSSRSWAGARRSTWRSIRTRRASAASPTATGAR
jgi:thiosulfate reductase / polysulfide reductase chain A